MNNSSKSKLGVESIGKLLFQLAMPSIIAQIINVLYNMVDRMYIGNIKDVGQTALTGVGVTFPIIMIISAFAALVGMGGAPRASIMMGKKQNSKAEEILGNCFSLQILVSIVLTVLYFVFSEQLLYLFGASENTIGYAKDYMFIYALGTVFVQISLGLNAFITSQGFTRTSMLTVMIGAIVNIILDPILIFGFNLGVRGAALATIISQAISAIWVLAFLTGKTTIIKIKKQYLRIKPKVIGPTLLLGLSPFIMQSTESALLLTFNASLIKFGGDMAVGAMTILSSVMQFALLPIQGLTQGCQPIISYNYGAKKLDRVKKAFNILLISSIVYSFVIWTISIFAPNIFVRIFTSNAELKEISSWGLRIYMASSCLFGAQIACQQTFIALGNAKTSLFLALLRKVILLIPLILILPHFFSDKVFAVFLAEPIADATAVVITLITFYISFNKLMKKDNLLK